MTLPAVGARFGGCSLIQIRRNPYARFGGGPIAVLVREITFTAQSRTFTMASPYGFSGG
jgi:hypothetical protein